MCFVLITYTFKRHQCPSQRWPLAILAAFHCLLPLANTIAWARASIVQKGMGDGANCPGLLQAILGDGNHHPSLLWVMMAIAQAFHGRWLSLPGHLVDDGSHSPIIDFLFLMHSIWPKISSLYSIIHRKKSRNIHRKNIYFYILLNRFSFNTFHLLSFP